jgi:hypothetical protein
MSDKVQVKYTAPPDDSKVCEMGGKTFFDGKTTELDSEEDAALIETISHNKCFENLSDPGGSGSASKSETDPKAVASGAGRASGGNYADKDNSPKG